MSNGKYGYYPICNKEEWTRYPKEYKKMDFLPVEMYNLRFDRNETTAVKEVVFETPFLEPYGVGAKISVHRQHFLKIMMCLHPNTQCQLYSVCSVKFENGETRGAKWVMDTSTGSFAIMSGSHYVAKQGGFQGYISKDGDGVITHEEITQDPFMWERF